MNQELPPTVEYLLKAGHQAPSADNLQPWRFVVSETAIQLRHEPEAGDDQVFGRNSHCALLMMGAVIENLVQAATAIGQCVDWDFTHDDTTYLSIPIDPAQKPVQLPDLPLFRRHTNRLGYRKDALRVEIVDALRSFRQGECRLDLATEKQKITALSAFVGLGSQLRFQTPVLHDWFGKVLRFSEKEVDTGTGLDVRTIDLPPGGSLLIRLIQDWSRLSVLNKLGMYKLLAQIEAGTVRDAPLLLSVIGPGDMTSVLDAGRLMERAWIFLNGEGIAVQPFYVVPEYLQRLANGGVPGSLLPQAEELAAMKAKLFPGDLTLHMMFRAGYPKRTPVLSKRMALERVIVRAP